jgi:ParB family transcriptional regulator, chromosome partitioning protein
VDPLGKGLESLIPDRQPDETPAHSDAHKEESPSLATALESQKSQQSASDTGPGGARTYHDHFTPRRGESIFWIEIDKIEANPFQPRREFDDDALKGLASSIREHGILQPVLVTKRETETPNGLEVSYQLIAGERRWRAAQRAGLSQIPAVIRRGIPDDKIRLELALIENVQREDLNAMERAHAFKQLVDEFNMVQREIGERIGKSREMVANTLRLLTLPKEIQDGVQRGSITEGHARAILVAGDDTPKQFQIFNEIITDRLNVREAENRARQIAGKTFTPRRRPAAVQDPEMRAWQDRLQERLGTKVHLQRMGERGKIVVEFYSEEELRGLLGKLVKEL